LAALLAAQQPAATRLSVHCTLVLQLIARLFIAANGQNDCVRQRAYFPTPQGLVPRDLLRAAATLRDHSPLARRGCVCGAVVKSKGVQAELLPQLLEDQRKLVHFACAGDSLQRLGQPAVLQLRLLLCGLRMLQLAHDRAASSAAPWLQTRARTSRRNSGRTGLGM